MITGGYLFAAVSCSSSSRPILFVCFFFGFVSSCWPFSVRILQRRCSFFLLIHWRIGELWNSGLFSAIAHCFILCFSSHNFLSKSIYYPLTDDLRLFFFFFVFLRAAANELCGGIINMARLCSALRFRDSSESLLPWSFTVSFFAIIER